MTDSPQNLYQAPIAMPDPFAETSRLDTVIARSREICGLPPIDTPEPLGFGAPTGVSVDLLGKYGEHAHIVAGLGSFGPAVVSDGEILGNGMDQR